MSTISLKEKAIELFHTVYSSSKAYKHFVDSHSIDIRSIKTAEDFEKIPIMDRHNYINKYTLEDRLYDGKHLSDYYMISASSGSTGQPTFWPRDAVIDEQLEKLKEKMYEEHFHISEKKTLCVVAFILGIWTGGILTVKLSWGASKKNRFTVVTPGINKKDVLMFISKLYKSYDQIILLGYPPFITDFIEYANQDGFDLKKVNLKIMCTGDRFSEIWRKFVIDNISKQGNRYDVVGFYATSDTGIIGAETKFCIDLLNIANEDTRFSRELFHSENPPTVNVYDPEIKFLECINSEIIITAKQPVPLIRYNIHDRGGLINGDEIKKICDLYKIPYQNEDIKHNYVYILGRSDSVLIAANIYIDDIKYCLEHSNFSNRFSGYFKYGRTETKDMRLRLKVVIFLRQNQTISPSEEEAFAQEFHENLLKINDDYRIISETTNMKKISFTFKPDEADKFHSTKLKYFL